MTTRMRKACVLTLAACAGLFAVTAFHAQEAAPGYPVPYVGYPLKADLSAPLREMPSAAAPLCEPESGERERPQVWPPSPKGILKEAAWRDPVLQSSPGLQAMPQPGVSFEGISNRDYAVPPDTNGDVGLNHYVQWVNLSLAIWDKSGNLLYGPVEGNSIWSGFGGPCDSCNDGDPVALYDRLADRWVVSQFALPDGNGPFYQYVAVSQTGDPTGSWYRYAYKIPGGYFGDYPKLGVWPDGYYMTANQFGDNWGGVGVFVLDREKMLAGDPSASFQYVNLGATDKDYSTLLPSHFEGSLQPPAGAPCTFVTLGKAANTLDLWELHVDWANPYNTTFGLSGKPNQTLPTAPFDPSLCNYKPCVQQPDTTERLDSLSDFLMYRLQYRNYGTYETLVVNHTVDVDGKDHAGIRWYEIRRQGGTWSIFQQGTFAPDTDSRWMGSVAMDHAGDLAVGYSVASTTTYPSIRYAGRLASDPQGELTQGEAVLMAGSGSQTTVYDRWGDYSTLSVDPVDDCTFWYTQEYYPSTSRSGWHTRIGSFTFPSCVLRVAAAPASDTGPIPFVAAFASTVTGGKPPYTYDWDFGDGSAHSEEPNVSHTYPIKGAYTWRLTVKESLGLSVTATGTVTATVPPPVISSVSKQSSPFRLKIPGSNFHSGCTIKVNGTAVPQTVFKSATLLQATGGTALKNMLPKGVPASITVVNNDDGGVSAPYTFTP